MNIFKEFYQPLDQFDLYYMNNINHQPFFSIYLQNFFLKTNLTELLFTNLYIYILLLLTFIFLFTSKILMKRLKLVSSSL
jgi:hypothetical protein